ncbi:MAG: hypothetical protein M3354_06365 [Chloroflexota bacterium]|nr:hypothetical protein [Chloroflexota bacterium]
MVGRIPGYCRTADGRFAATRSSSKALACSARRRLYGMGDADRGGVVTRRATTLPSTLIWR